MTMPTIPRIISTTALCLAALGVSSCTTVIDTGSMLDNEGKEAPSRLLEKNKINTVHGTKRLPWGHGKKVIPIMWGCPWLIYPAGIQYRDCLVCNMSLLRTKQF